MESFEQTGERISLWWRQICEEARESFAQRRLRRAQGPLTMLGELERLAAAVVLEPCACNEVAVFERGEKLRDGSRGDRGAAGQLRADDLSLGDRLQGKVLSDCERRIVCRE